MSFRFGNYHQYYGYRNQKDIDSRILCMKHEWFTDKDVLDIGCNAGHFTLTIAKDFSPRCIIGVDIDKELIKMAKKNVRHYIDKRENSDFPIQFPLEYGPIAKALGPSGEGGKFPYNLQFIQGNYILSSDEIIEQQEEYFDTVLCLSLTKWIHLNWGDLGIRRLFQRIFRHLRPQGYLILEAQAYETYAKKKKVTKESFEHYKHIKLFPDQFNEYLVKTVGFESCELIDTPAHSSKGFSRPIFIFKKGGEKQPQHMFYNVSSESECNDSDIEQLSD